MPDIPLIIAHRGASAAAPENTLAAFALACQQGADMLELDVQRCADGTPVVFHDATTERWNGEPRPLAACTLAEVRALDIGGEQVPTLAEVLAFAREQGVALNVELKGLDSSAAVVTLVQQYGLHEQVLLSAFDPRPLLQVRAYAPQLARGALLSYPPPNHALRLAGSWPMLYMYLRWLGVQAWHPPHTLPRLRRWLPLLRRAGYRVNVWTVDDPQRIRQLAAWGASGIITNDPAAARSAVAQSDRSGSDRPDRSAVSSGRGPQNRA
jgi:glycerophosphoryl diester phosphodiesterase